MLFTGPREETDILASLNSTNNFHVEGSFIFLKSMFNLIPFSIFLDTQYVASFKPVLNFFLLSYWSYM